MEHQDLKENPNRNRKNDAKYTIGKVRSTDTDWYNLNMAITITVDSFLLSAPTIQT